MHSEIYEWSGGKSIKIINDQVRTIIVVKSVVKIKVH